MQLLQIHNEPAHKLEPDPLKQNVEPNYIPKRPKNDPRRLHYKGKQHKSEYKLLQDNAIKQHGLNDQRDFRQFQWDGLPGDW